ALIFTAESAIPLPEIKACLEEYTESKINKEAILEIIESIQTKYQNGDFAFELVEIANGYQFLTKSDHHDVIGLLLKQKTKKKLTKAALETLSIIAYKQPLPKSEIEAIRGVSCDYSIQKLLEKELISIAGRSYGPGKPLLYQTSAKFMDYFGLKTIGDLPKLRDFKVSENTIGEGQSIEELKADPQEKTPENILQPINPDEEE
ncbi:MAG: SMC-Scp complex subunit ScpB, partial [Bacteroidota bacterium]